MSRKRPWTMSTKYGHRLGPFYSGPRIYYTLWDQHKIAAGKEDVPSFLKTFSLSALKTLAADRDLPQYGTKVQLIKRLTQ